MANDNATPGALPRTMAQTGLTAPSWAGSHEEIDGGIQWVREIAVEIEPSSTMPDAAPDVIKVHVYVNDEMVVHDDGRVEIERKEPPILYIGDQRMTLRQARTFAGDIVALVDVVEAGA